MHGFDMREDLQRSPFCTVCKKDTLFVYHKLNIDGKSSLQFLVNTKIQILSVSVG